ncbi:hypothetical protein [uncultured Mailhella sp.]|uniref:hypothetical protein n=1 Tax=uncultured Mailhella sp. TaxID=1981031 RepID=UPI002633FE19|nr:hypothetical protein [uncultured Mailhella sp.]
MARLEIHFKEAFSVADEIDSLGKDISRCSDQVSTVLKNLKRYRSAAFTPLYVRLQTVNDALLEEAAKMDSLEDALRHIINTYSNSENRILEFLGAGSSEKTTNAEDNEADESIFKRFIDWIKSLFGWKEETKEEPLSITREQEKEHDLYMQNEIFALLETPAYNKETWSRATVEQRKDILQNYLAELSTIYGVKISSEIDFCHLGTSTRGQYSPNSKQVTINEDYLSRTDSYQIMQTMIHEMRHAYQYAAVEDPGSYNVSAETIEQWKNNFAPGNYYSGDDYSRYVSQPIEYDAKNFAKQYNDLARAKPEYKGSWE